MSQHFPENTVLYMYGWFNGFKFCSWLHLIDFAVRMQSIGLNRIVLAASDMLTMHSKFRLRKVISSGILTISIRVIVTFRMTHGTFQLINMYNSNEMKFYFLRFGKKKTTFSLVYLLICLNSRTQYIANTKYNNSQYRYTFQSFWYRF